MAEVQPFRAWRYDLSQVGSLSDVTAPPYDVINPALQKQLYELHPCNVVRLILNRAEPGDDGPADPYRRAANYLHQWQSDGTLRQDREEALYVYHQEFECEGRRFVRKGFLGRLRLEELGQGRVYPHEQTLSGPKADRLRLTKACRMNLSPVFGLYPDDGESVQTPLEDAARGVTAFEAADSLGVVHRVWAISDHAAIRAVRQRLHDKPIFIADGHHRYETALNYRNTLQAEGRLGDDSSPANYVLMHFVGMSDPGLAILPTHRLVAGLPDLTADELRSVLGAHFELEALGQGDEAARSTWELVAADGGQDVLGFGTAADGQWQLARVTDSSPMARLVPSHSEQWRSLAVSLLHKLVLEHLLKSGSAPAKLAGAEPDFTYVHRFEEAAAAVRERSCQLACLVPPVDIEHVEEIASKFETMPPKSTYFYPKLLSGLLFNPLQ